MSLPESFDSLSMTGDGDAGAPKACVVTRGDFGIKPTSFGKAWRQDPGVGRRDGAAGGTSTPKHRFRVGRGDEDDGTAVTAATKGAAKTHTAKKGSVPLPGWKFALNRNGDPIFHGTCSYCNKDTSVPFQPMTQQSPPACFDCNKEMRPRRLKGVDFLCVDLLIYTRELMGAFHALEGKGSMGDMAEIHHSECIKNAEKEIGELVYMAKKSDVKEIFFFVNGCLQMEEGEGKKRWMARKSAEVCKVECIYHRFHACKTTVKRRMTNSFTGALQKARGSPGHHDHGRRHCQEDQRTRCTRVLHQG